ncbi:hypothetical protein XACN24_12055 [Xanthomonas albilineans]|uniref:Putative nicotinamide synthase cyclopropane fatty acid synthase protein n=2 Tax=Xanthomonas albilineans TaxID=29447 RepID=D2U9J8_XANAP|nr:nicotianamine synthase family protein [Xanthomonas albilineans]CBA16950.1 putative nicotinamide synthase; cyclopropane fatty acid synthase protein [Xanthomonas albilineans GPE PC73]
MHGEDLLARGGSREMLANESVLRTILRCNSPLQQFICTVADFLNSQRSESGHTSVQFHELDLLMEHVESRIFYATEVDELVFGLRRETPHDKVLQEAYCLWETTLERNFVSRLCGGSATAVSDYRLAGRLQRLVRREVSMLRTQPERILFIGSGPLPLSAIWFSRILDVHVDGIDISKSAVEESSTLIKVLGLDRSIRIIHRNAVDYDVSNYDMIVIALLAKPKQLLLDNIARTARSDCTIVCRTSFGLRSLIYEPTFFSSAILDNFDIEDIRLVKGASDDTVSSLKLSIRNL